MYREVGYYLQMVAAFLLLSLTHYFAAAFLPIGGPVETYLFVEPLHFLLYGSGKQAWSWCPQWGLHSWTLPWMYAWPTVFIRGSASLSSPDVFFFLRIFNGRVASLAELFFVYSVWDAFSGKAAMVALLLLLGNYAVTHAAVSVSPTSFVMVCNFVVLGCWLRTRSWSAASRRWKPHLARLLQRSSSSRGPLSTAASPARADPQQPFIPVAVTLFFCVVGLLVGWPVAFIIVCPIVADLSFRFPSLCGVCAGVSLVLVSTAVLLVDRHHYGRWTLSSWNAVAHGFFAPVSLTTFATHVKPPWWFYVECLLLNFHVVAVIVAVAPLVVLCAPRRAHRRLSALEEDLGESRSLRSRLRANGQPHRSSFSPLASPTRSRLRTSNANGTPSGFTSSLLARSPTQMYGAAAPGSCSRGRELLYMAPFFLWAMVCSCAVAKDEALLAPSYPFLMLAATRAACLTFFPDADEVAHRAEVGTTALHYLDRTDPCPWPSRRSSHSASVPGTQASLSPSQTWRRIFGVVFLALFILFSYSRAMTVYVLNSGPERLFYDWYPVLQEEARQKMEAVAAAHDGATMPDGSALPFARRAGATSPTGQLSRHYVVCVGESWHRFPSSFFLDHRSTRFHFVRTPRSQGRRPSSFVAPAMGYPSAFLWPVHGVDGAEAAPSEASSQGLEYGSCTCGVPDRIHPERPWPEPYVSHPLEACDAVFDALPPSSLALADKVVSEDTTLLQLHHLDTVFTRSLLNNSLLERVMIAGGEPYRPVDETYVVADVDQAPFWCRLASYPLGLSRRCAVWRPLFLRAKP